MDAARFWARGSLNREADDEARGQVFRDAGVCEAEIAAAFPDEAPGEDDAFELWPDNAAVFDLFCSLATRWDILAGFGFIRYVGLQYGEAEVLMRARRLKDRAALFADLHLMELAALPLLNKTDDE